MTPSSSPIPDLAALLSLAHDLADAAREVIRPYFRQPIDVDLKVDHTPVTIADREAERVMRSMLADRVPEHGVVGEEFGADRAEAEWVWVLDPIDGTQAFLSGQPTFGTLIALLHNGTPILGLIDQAITRERWVGAQGEGATLNGAAIQTRLCTDLSTATVFATSPAMFQEADAACFERLSERANLVRYGLDCYAYGLLALGFVDVVAECQMELYDYAALVPIVEAAGGVISDWRGEPLKMGSDGRVLALGDAALQMEALRLLDGEQAVE
ncbi:MAG: histidinol-phosphatase [Chloroflexi bacterium]|nr:histidinol-phosphatase [Chloroflexota bacterium]